MTRHILTGVAGSPSSENAAHWAAGEAQRRGVPLRRLHAWPWLSPEGAEDTGDFRPDDLLRPPCGRRPTSPRASATAAPGS